MSAAAKQLKPSDFPQTGEDARRAIRSGQWTGPTSGMAPGYVQGNLAILPNALAPYFARLASSVLLEAAVSIAVRNVRPIATAPTVPMYRTSVPTAAAGPFHGPLVVSMRPLKPADAIRAIQITTRFPAVHGAPVHIGKP